MRKANSQRFRTGKTHLKLFHKGLAMKIFYCQTQAGIIKKMTLDKIIRQKKIGKPVKIIGVSEIIKKSVKMSK